MPMNTTHHEGWQRGIGMIEVLAALFVISVGVLSFAKTEGLALSETGIAARRSIAAFEADSLASAMHANEAFWQKTVSANVPFTVTIDGTANPATITNTLLSNNQTTSCTSGTPPACDNSHMAYYDVYTWAQQLLTNKILPSYTATIKCDQASASVPVSCSININWGEGAIASITNTAYVSSSLNSSSPNYWNLVPSYTLYVQP